MSLLHDGHHEEQSQCSLAGGQEKEYCESEMSNSEVGFLNVTKHGENNDSHERKDEVCCCMEEKNDYFNLSSSDSLSSNASISDSDLTSTDSEDSLALSESESITDVTPLNSPYCNSPLLQNKHLECQLEEKPSNCATAETKRPEMNVLMKAIEKLQLEAKNNPDMHFRDSVTQRVTSVSLEETKRIEQENQKLLNLVISQQNHIKSIYSPYTPRSKSVSCRNEDLKSDVEISDSSKISLIGQTKKHTDKVYVHRRQKCLSHPSTFMYSHDNHIDKNDSFCFERVEKKKCTFGEKNRQPQHKKKFEERNLGFSNNS